MARTSEQTRFHPPCLTWRLVGLLLAALVCLPSVAPAQSPPATPSAVTVTRDNGTLTATWPAVTGATKYHVTYTSDNTKSWSAAADPADNYSASTITITGVDNTKTYIVGVRAGNDDDQWSGWRNSPASPPLTPPTPPPGRPASVSVTRASGTLTASWPAVSGATKYHVTYTSDNTKSWTSAADGHTTTSITFNAADAKTYIVGVRAGDDYGQWSGWRNSPASAPLTPPPPPPPAPAQVHVSRVCDHDFAVWWDKSAGATGYDLNYSGTNRQSWQRLRTNTPTNSWYGTQYGQVKTFWFAVRAVNDGGASAWVNSAAAHPPPCQPDTLRAVTRTTEGQTGGSITATWDAGKRAAAYNVNHRFNGGPWQRIESNVAGTTHTWDVDNTGNYVVAVQSINGNLMSKWRNADVSAWLSAGNVVGTTATLTVSGHGGDWYYQANAAPDNACQGPVSATTKDLAGLTGGTAYVYTAYTDSACANAIAAAAFTTPGLSASSVTTSSATLTISEHTGTWYVKKTAPAPAGNCSAAISSGATHDLTNLTPGQSYTYKAYRDSGCATEITALTFSTVGLSAGNVAATTATLNLTGHTGAWYYQANAAPDNTCRGPVSTAAKNLTGLTAGTTYYIYTAYSDSACTSALHSAAFATPVTVSNLSETVYQYSCVISGRARCAMGFTTGSAAGGYTLAEITAKFADKIDPNDDLGDVVVTLHAAAANSVGDRLAPAGTTLATLSGSNPDTAGDYTYSCSGSGCALMPSATYFVQFSATTGDVVDEKYVLRSTQSNEQTTVPSGNGWTLLDETDYGSPTYTIRFPEASLVQLSATVNASLAASSVTATGATLTLSNHAGAWWLKRTNPAAATCKSMGTTTTETLTGLNPAQSYTYTAYGDSACAAALLPVTFSTHLTVSNLGQTTHQSLSNETGYKNSNANRRWANAFTTGSAAGGYTLAGVTFEFGATTGSPTRVHAKIYADSSGMPGALVKNLGSKNPTAAGNHTWNCSGDGCALSSDTTYHVALEADAPTAASGHYYDWKITASGSETNAPGDAGWTIEGHGNYKINAGAWTAYGDEAGKFQVAAVANPGLAVSNLADATATLTLSNYSGAWWLQRTNPADAACKAMGMTTTENLTNLTVGQSYTYKAYRKAGCASADEIASVTLATVGLTASVTAGADTGTLSIAGHTGNWYVKQTAPAGSCSRAIRGATHNLTGLTPGRTYTYKAYAKSGCASADEIASVTFRVAYLSVSNLGEATYVADLPIGQNGHANAFTTGSATGGYALKSVTVDMNSPNAGSPVLVVEVRTASGSNPAAVALTTLSGPNPTSAGQYTYVCSTNCALTKDTTYYLALSATNAAESIYHQWRATTSDAETAVPAGSGWSIANVAKRETSVGNGSWDDTGSGRSGKFRVTAKTGTGLSVTNVGPTAATLNVSNHSGGWWYQGSQSGATCTSVTSGTTTARVTGLSPTTSYTYTAYDKAGCNAADELDAPVTFRTTPPTLTPGTPTATTVTLTIDGHSGNWYYQYTAPSGGTCSSGAVAGATANVTGLSKNQSYTFKAYSDNGCATLIATAPAFTTTNPALAASNVISDGATLTLTGWAAGTGTGKDGNWHYKADAAPHTACSSAQTAGAVTLSGLTIGGTYTYTAYSDSGCTTALATAAAFTTANPVLRVGSVARTSATLAMAYYAGNWYYKADVGPDNTCQGPVSGGAGEALTGLTADTAYTYRAYDKSVCNSADEIESLAFTTSSLTAGNVSQTDATNSCAVSGDAKCAVGFTTGSATGGYVLTGITAKFNAASDAADALGDLAVTLHASASNTVGDNKRPADAALATLSGGNPTAAGNHTFTCSGTGCVLAASTTYFVQMSATAGAVSDEYYDWATTAATGQTLDPTNNGWTLLDETDTYTGSSWTRQAEIGKLLLSVSTQPRLEALDVTASGATLTLSLHTAAWWYQQTGSSNCTSVNAGTRTATLSTLTASTSYTYKAYDKSGCNSADEIASVTFTTFATITVSNLTETAHGTLLGVTPASFEAVAFTTGVSAGGYQLKSVTVKFGAPSTNQNPGAGPATVKIHAVGSDGNPAASHTYHLGSHDPTAAGDFTFNCVKSQTRTCRLAQQTTYFVVIEGSTTWSEGAQRVTMTASGNQTNTPVGAGWGIADAAKYGSSNKWTDEDGITVMLKITAETRASAGASGASGAAQATAGLTRAGPAVASADRHTSPTGAMTAGVRAAGAAAGAPAGAAGNAAAAGAAHPSDYVTNLTSAQSGDSDVDATQRQAVAFTTGPSPGGYTLKRFTAALRKVSGNAGLVLTLHDMASDAYGDDSQPSETVLATLVGSAPASGAYADVTYTCAGSGCRLAPDTTYFVVAQSSGSGAYAWAYVASANLYTETTVPSDSGWILGASHYAQDGEAWASFGDWHHARLDFETHPVLSVGNLAEAPHPDACFPSGDAACAVGFTTGSAAGGYTLRALTARFADADDPDGNLGVLVVTLHADNAGVPGQSLATPSGDNPTEAGDYTYTCSGTGCALKPDTTYFVQVSATAGEYLSEAYAWSATLSDHQTPVPADNGWTLANGTTAYRSAWQTYPDVGLLEIVVTP